MLTVTLFLCLVFLALLFLRRSVRKNRIPIVTENSFRVTSNRPSERPDLKCWHSTLSINNGLPRLVRITGITLKQGTQEIRIADPDASHAGSEAGKKIKLHIRSCLSTPFEIAPSSSIIGIVVIPVPVPMDLTKPENVMLIIDGSEGILSFPLFPLKSQA